MDEELLLQQELMASPPAPYTQLVEHEWTTFDTSGGGVGSSAPTDHIGKGDLVFQVPSSNDYLVVETKHLRTDSGRTARAKRTTSRKKVTEQAFRYGAIWRGHMGSVDGSVTMATYTNTSASAAPENLSSVEEDGEVANNETRKLDILGQVDYLTPHLFDSNTQSLLTEEELEIMNEQLFRRVFMAVRILESPHDYLDQSYTPEQFQKQYQQSKVRHYLEEEAKLSVSPQQQSPYYLGLHDIADSVLNHHGGGFFEPFGPHFVIAPNDQRQLLRNLQSFLRRLK